MIIKVFDNYNDDKNDAQNKDNKNIKIYLQNIVYVNNHP